MPARDIFHETAKRALLNDGWTVTHDPLTVKFGGRNVFVDLGAERFLGAEKGGRRIAVEIKSFVGLSEMRDLHNAVGQFILYEDVLKLADPERTLFLAVHDEAYRDVFEDPIGRLLLENGRLRFLVFDAGSEKVLRWIP